MRRLLERLLLLAGLVGLLVLVGTAGSIETGRIIAFVGWWLVPIILLGAVPHLLDTIGLYCCLPRGPRLRSVFAARLAGEGLNALVPTATVGGELLKASLLSRRVNARAALAAITAAYALDALAALSLSSIGLPFAFARLGLSPLARQALAALLLAGMAGTTVFWRLIRSGSIVRGVDPGRPYSLAYVAMFASTAWTVAEIAIVRFAASGELDLEGALAMGSSATLLDAVFFFVPGQIGTREGGLAAITALAGLGAPLGIAIGLVRRARETVWTLIGYGCFVVLERRRQPDEPAWSGQVFLGSESAPALRMMPSVSSTVRSGVVR
ncbi:MAG TPA: lysylphosphatidylglycerol synthase domain-containing protein [Planctomycetota bacterium]|nr:lysylphosphatidylglycerol synthase domain-containing protein [Planctomycetota bacterium]